MIIIISLLMMGWLTKVSCWLQNKSAPSLFLPYFTIYKLLKKQPVMAENASWLFQFAPYIYLSSVIIICFSLPFFITKALTSTKMDMIVIIGLFGLARIILALAAMDIGTAFGSLGSRREMFVACLSEPILFIVFYNIAILTHTSYLYASSLYFINHIQIYPSLLFALIALVLVLLAETNRIPIDNPETHLELTMIHAAMTLEYSGRYLALIELSNAIKVTLYLGFIAALFFPFGMSTNFLLPRLVIAIILAVIKLFIFSTLIAVIGSLNSKLRLFKVPDYLASAFMLAVLSVLITQLITQVAGSLL